MDYAIGLTIVSLKVLVGLGFVIFVHELGHFAVAKFCGVKCEKFYLGFDFFGWKFCKVQWGETEYGIGIFPLGGYVKMLGQEDNPAKVREEFERAKQQTESGREGEGERGSDSASPSTAASESLTSAYDPRSFLAKSVPKRMAIIAAGVIMNMIFAFLMAVVAFQMGVIEVPCIVGQVFPGEAAWRANLHSGDKILKIAGKPMQKFRDLQTSIFLGDIDPEKGVPFVIQRDGKELDVTVKPNKLARNIYSIGVAGQNTTRLVSRRETWLNPGCRPVILGSAAARATPAFENGDKIVQIDDVPITSYSQINEIFARKVDQKITVVVERRGPKSESNKESDKDKKEQRVSITVEPDPMRNLGLVMTMGPVTAIQENSPAAAAKIQPGDLVLEPADDPMRLPDRLRRQAGKDVDLKLQREKEKSPIECALQPRQPTGFAPPMLNNGSMGASTVGLAYQVLNRVERVEEGSPAAKAGLRPGDVLVKGKLIPPSADELQKLGVDPHEDLAAMSDISGIEFDDTKHNWPQFFSLLQESLPGTKVELTFKRGEETITKTMEPVAATDWHNPARGLRFEPVTIDQPGNPWALGAARTWDDVTVVFHSVRGLSTGQVPMRGLAGPWMIIKMALQAADAGTVKLLLFLAFLSANLAVLNALPIPVLDGGHFVLLCYEGIRGKPADERVQAVLAYVGLALILALMVWVLGLDFGLISRQ